MDAMKDAMIDVQVMLLDKSDPKANDGNPFGALGLMPATSPPEGLEVIDDIVQQVVNLDQQLRDAPIPMAEEESSLHSIGSVTRDAIETLKAAHDKAAGVAPEKKYGIPY
jgi:hypothetical protein